MASTKPRLRPGLFCGRRSPRTTPLCDRYKDTPFVTGEWFMLHPFLWAGTPNPPSCNTTPDPLCGNFGVLQVSGTSTGRRKTTPGHGAPAGFHGFAFLGRLLGVRRLPVVLSVRHQMYRRRDPARCAVRPRSVDPPRDRRWRGPSGPHGPDRHRPQG